MKCPQGMDVCKNNCEWFLKDEGMCCVKAACIALMKKKEDKPKKK